MPGQDLIDLPIRFDPVNFADHERELHGLVATRSMVRLKENVVFTEAAVVANITFQRGMYGYPLVQGAVEAKVRMRCERCLDEVAVEVNPEISVLVTPKEDDFQEKQGEEAENLPDIHECEGKNLELADLIEEEILLALPLVPKHKDISLCNQDMIAWLAANEGPDEDQAPARKNKPFAILKSVD